MKKIFISIFIALLITGCSTISENKNEQIIKPTEKSKFILIPVGNGILRFDHYTGKTWVLINGTNFWQPIDEKSEYVIPPFKMEDLEGSSY